jgi:hypothetical protein
MSDLQNYIRTRKTTAPAFAADYDAGYQQFKTEAMKQQAFIQTNGRLQTQPPTTLQIDGQHLAYG